MASSLIPVPGKRFVIGVPYVWLIVFFFLPFLILLYISFVDMGDSISPFKPLWDPVTGVLQLKYENYLSIFRMEEGAPLFKTLYVEAYLRAHPGIHPGMTLMVRTLEPTSEGVPVELYCFTATTVWAEYERIQGDVFDHLLAMLPEFDLEPFQAPTGKDLRMGLQERLRALAMTGAKLKDAIARADEIH